MVHQASINQQDLKSVLVALPELPEQTEIVEILDAAEFKLATEEQHTVALQALFETMLHGLMTGQLRVGDVAS